MKASLPRSWGHRTANSDYLRLGLGLFFPCGYSDLERHFASKWIDHKSSSALLAAPKLCSCAHGKSSSPNDAGVRNEGQDSWCWAPKCQQPWGGDTGGTCCHRAAIAVSVGLAGERKCTGQVSAGADLSFELAMLQPPRLCRALREVPRELLGLSLKPGLIGSSWGQGAPLCAEIAVASHVTQRAQYLLYCAGMEEQPWPLPGKVDTVLPTASLGP